MNQKTNKETAIGRKNGGSVLVAVFGALAAAVAAMTTVYFLVVWPWLSRWGAEEEEVETPLPGDDLLPEANLQTTKAIAIQASPEQVWPWLLQLGVDRGGMYSYEFIENLMGLGVENADQLRPEWQNLKAGDFIRFTPQEFALNPGPGLYVEGLEANRAMFGCFGLENARPEKCQGGTWQFVLEPQEDSTTRLLLRNRTEAGSTLARAGLKIGHLFQFIMERKMLLVIKDRAESAS